MMVSRLVVGDSTLLIPSSIRRLLPDEMLRLTFKSLVFRTALFVSAVSGVVLRPAAPTSQPLLGHEEQVYDPAPTAAWRPFDTLVHRAFPEYTIRVKKSPLFCATSQTCGCLPTLSLCELKFWSTSGLS